MRNSIAALFWLLFALLGAWPQCLVVSVKSGHRLHAKAAKSLRATYAPRLAVVGR